MPVNKSNHYSNPSAWVPWGILLLISVPTLLLVATGLFSSTSEHWSEVFYRPFWNALGRSLKQMAWSGGLAVLVGWPLGTMLGLYRFPFKRICLFVLGLPLVLPPFLWAIGIQSLQPFISYRNQIWFDGFSGCVLAFAALMIPIVSLAAFTSTQQIKRSELEATVLYGHKLSALWLSLRHALPAVLGATLLGSALTLSDSGAGQIMGYHGASGEILIAFSAKHDFVLAAIKASVIALGLIPLVSLGVWTLMKGVDFKVSARKLIKGDEIELKTGARSWMFGLAMVFVSGILLFPAMFGLVRPLLQPPSGTYFKEAFGLFVESLPITALYGVSAALIAGLGAVCVVIFLVRSKRSVQDLLFFCLLLFSLPPSLNALGMLRIGTSAPAALDFLFRSGWIVGVAEGFHFMPLAIVLLLVAWQRVPVSFREAAELHGVSRLNYLLRVSIPSIARPLVAVSLLCGLLALADVTSTVLLQPPGGSSYGTHLFGIMDNSSEKLVAAFCLVYMLVPMILFSTMYLALVFGRKRS